jgi:hypothetical protein
VQGGIDEEDPDTAAREATAWAFAYQAPVIENGGKWRMRIVPYFDGSDGSSMPPRVSTVPEAGVAAWAALSEKVSSNFGKVRLHHLLFERKAGNVTTRYEHRGSTYSLPKNGRSGSIKRKRSTFPSD